MILLFREKTRLYKVYHIHEVGNRNIQEGYVGITRRSLSYRLSQHMCSKRPVGTILRQLGKDNIQIDLIAMLPKEEALTMEYNLRPKMNMGWNARAGGDRKTVSCPICGKYLPHRKTGTVCADCLPTTFQKGHVPHNYGHGERFRLIAPDGTMYEPESFTAFCREHNLTPQNLRQVAKGNRHHSNGWKAERIG